MKPRWRELADRATQAFQAALSLYNSPIYPYRIEIFVVLALNAWELLIKAKWLKENKNKLTSLLIYDKKRKQYKKTKSERYITRSVLDLAEKLLEQGHLEKNVHDNLEILTDFRNSVVHFYMPSQKLIHQMQQVSLATVRNFVFAMEDWFGIRIVEQQIPYIVITPVIPPEIEGVPINPQEKRFLSYLQRKINSEPQSAHARYTIAMKVRVVLEPSSKSIAREFRLNDNIRDLYPLDYKQLVEECRRRYPGFKINQRFHSLRKALFGKREYAFERKLDPTNPKSPSKVFYTEKIFEVLDENYKGRETLP